VITEDGATVETHLVRSNPLARALAEGPVPALLAVSGPDGYVSPDWYGAKDQVPTWNYVAVHLRGPLALAPAEALTDVLARLSDTFEPRLAPKRPWTMDKMTPATRERLLRAIVPARLTIEGVDGTWKLGQNKDEHARLGAAAAIEGSVGAELAALAALMRDPPA
jgi:transcriptional regulator